MSDEQPLSRPIGWWLKQADLVLDAAFDDVLEAEEIDRRGWQVLATLSTGPQRREHVVAALTPFDPPVVVDDVIERLRGREWVEDRSTLLQC